MKKILFATLVLIIVLISFILVSCNKDETSHFHVFGEWMIVKESTCINQGEMIRYCDCGEKQSEAIVLSDHTIVSIEGVGSTCQNTGLTDGKRCSVCNEVFVEQKEIPISGHTVVVIEGTEPTCQSTGLTDGEKCSVCNEVFVEQDEIAVSDHLPDEAVIENMIEANCSSDGSYDTVVYCYYCNEELSRDKIVIERNNHIPGEEVKENVVASTCSNNGNYDNVVYCSVCGVEISRTQKVINKLEHTYEDEICSVCGYTEGELGMEFELSYDGTYYSLVGLGTCTRTEIVIPSQYKGLPVKEIKSNSIANIALTSVIIPESIVNVGEYAFGYCPSLVIYCESASVNFDTNWNITYYYGHNQSKKEYQILPVVSDCNNNIYDANGRFFVTVEGLHYAVNKITREATVMAQPGNITRAIIPESISVDDVVYPVTDIAYNAFNMCTDLISLYLPKSLTYEIDSNTIDGCNALVIYFEESHESERFVEFAGSLMRNIYVDGNVYIVPNCKDNEYLWFYGYGENADFVGYLSNSIRVEVNGYLYYINLDDNYAIFDYQQENIPDTVVIPDKIVYNSVTYEVTEIRRYAHNYGNQTHTLVIPVTVNKIGEDAFLMAVGPLDSPDDFHIYYMGTKEQWDNIVFDYWINSSEENKAYYEKFLQCDYVL